VYICIGDFGRLSSGGAFSRFGGIGSLCAIGSAILAALQRNINPLPIGSAKKNPPIKTSTYRSTTSPTSAGGTGTTSPTTAASRTTTAGLVATTTFAAAYTTLGLRLRLAGKLDRHLALKDDLAIELRNGALSLGWSGQVDKGIANWTVGARIGRNRNRLAARGRQISAKSRHGPAWGQYIHKKVDEEVLQFSLSGRISEVPNVESAPCIMVSFFGPFIDLSTPTLGRAGAGFGMVSSLCGRVFSRSGGGLLSGLGSSGHGV
jgi:hypothetical protein